MTLPTLDVRPAALPDLCAVLRASALSFEQRGQPMWTQDSLTPERLERQYPGGQGYLGWLEGRPVAAMILLPSDPAFWPEDPAGEALYLHKLAVHPDWQGRGLGAQMIAAAMLETQAAGAALAATRHGCRTPEAAGHLRGAGLQGSARGQGARLARCLVRVERVAAQMTDAPCQTEQTCPLPI